MLPFSEAVKAEGLFAYCARLQRERIASYGNKVAGLVNREAPLSQYSREVIWSRTSEPIVKPLAVTSVDAIDDEVESPSEDDPIELSLELAPIVAGDDSDMESEPETVCDES